MSAVQQRAVATSVRGRPRCALRQRTPRDAGFSLVELVVVVLILGILAAIAIAALSGIEHTAKQHTLAAVATEAAAGAVIDLVQGASHPVPLVAAGFTAVWQGDTPPGRADEVCVVVTRGGTGESTQAGPGC